jgi:zinc transporter ZupT
VCVARPSLTVGTPQPCLPYALAFAAGAMIYVVVDDLVPEAHVKHAAHPEHDGSSWLSAGLMTGFVIMMSMDVAL